MKSRPAFAARAVLVLAGWVAVTAPLPAATSDQLKALQSQAEQFEQQSSWDKACLVYETILYHQRDYPGARGRYQQCLRRYFQARRHRDLSYRKDVLTLNYARALRLYQLMLTYLSEHALDRGLVTPEKMFRQGLDELDSALASPVFLRAHLPTAGTGEVDAFRATLRQVWGERSVYTIDQANFEVRQVVKAALQKLRLSATTVVLEFVCGSCYAVDDYTMYLTPAELRGLCDSLKGETVGVGVTLGLRGDRLILKDVLADSPAGEAEPPLFPEDRLVSINGKPTEQMPLEVAAELLQGEPGTLVDLVIHSPMLGERQVALRRRAVFVPSVVPPEVKGGAVGYVAIRGFQDSTVHELDEALAGLTRAGAKALVLDLRGNGGGVLEAAVESARRFVADGVIVTVQNQDSRQTVTHQARNPGALALPVVVLIDGDTASAAEILAGALKENHRARLVGQTTFGKGCVQDLLRFSPEPGQGFPGGLRLTVSRFLSPSGLPYTGRGVEPHVFARRVLNPDSLDPTDHQLEAALLEAQRMLDNLMQ